MHFRAGLSIIKITMVERERRSPGLTVIYGEKNPNPTSIKNLIADIIGGYDEVNAGNTEQQIRESLEMRREMNDDDGQNIVLRRIAQAFKNSLETAKKTGQLTLTLELPYYPHEQDDYDLAFNALGKYLKILGYNPEIESTMNIHGDDPCLPDNSYRIEVDLVNEN